MNKKTERIAIIGLLAFLVGYFCYQVAYGMDIVIGPNGTMPFSGNGTSAQFSAPPGSVIKNPSIRLEPNGYGVSGTFSQPSRNDSNFINFANTTWTMYNQTSGSTSTLTFGDDGKYVRSLHGNDLKGEWFSSPQLEQSLQMCPTAEKWMNGCIDFSFKPGNPNHLEFYDLHGDVIHLMR